MPCLVGVLALLFPRLVIVVLWLFTTFFQGVYDTFLIPILGFLFLPLTLLAYTWLTKSGQPVDAFYLVVMVLALAVDLGLVGGSARRRG
jgi:hypothetical protein